MLKLQDKKPSATGGRKLVQEPSEEEKRSMSLYPIGIVSELLGMTEQTLRLYEKHGLISPSRRNKIRYFSENDIKWLRCVRNLIHVKKISIEGIKKLLEYASCWDITECSDEVRENCFAFKDRSKRCWELKSMICHAEHAGSENSCEECSVQILKGPSRDMEPDYSI